MKTHFWHLMVSFITIQSLDGKKVNKNIPLHKIAMFTVIN